MDEEDLAEIKSSRTFKPAEGYGSQQAHPEGTFAGLGAPSSSGGSKARPGPGDAAYSTAVASTLNDLVKPGSRRIGQKIMSKMGWRPGQGIGPRISYARRREQMRELGLSEELSDAEDDEEARKHTFAPIDRTVITFEHKDNQWGLGYVPGKTLDQRLENTSRTKSALPFRVTRATRKITHMPGEALTRLLRLGCPRAELSAYQRSKKQMRTMKTFTAQVLRVGEY